MMALEVAMDEMAEKLVMDPVELRIVNDTQVDPSHPRAPVLAAHMVQCLRMGAEQVRLEPAQRQARHRPRRALADRHGRGQPPSATTST